MCRAAYDTVYNNFSLADTPHSSPPCSQSKINHELECGPMPNVMAAQPNIGGALCESCVIPFVVPCRKAWLTPAAGVPCSNAANIGERKTWTQSEFCTWQNSVRGQESLYIVCQPRRWQMSCKVSLTSVERRRCSNDESQDAKSVEICSGAPNSRIDLSR